ncbi:MAG: hypothetical protein ACLUYK_03025 [Eggerthella lenta]
MAASELSQDFGANIKRITFPTEVSACSSIGHNMKIDEEGTMSTDHPGLFRYGIRFKIAVSIGVIMVALMAVETYGTYRFKTLRPRTSS